MQHTLLKDKVLNKTGVIVHTNKYNTKHLSVCDSAYFIVR